MRKIIAAAALAHPASGTAGTALAGEINGPRLTTATPRKATRRRSSSFQAGSDQRLLRAGGRQRAGDHLRPRQRAELGLDPQGGARCPRDGGRAPGRGLPWLRQRRLT